MNGAMLWPNSNLYELRVSDSAVVLATASFAVYRIFKRFEPDKPIATVPLLLVIPSLLVPFLHVHITNLPLAISATFTLYYIFIFAYTALYRLSPVHPLAKYPGPARNKLSKLWMSYIASTGKQHVYLRKLHDQYGDVVRVGPNELSVNRVDALTPILGVPGMPKGPWWYNRVPPGKTNALITSRDPAEHKRRRKPWDRAFSSTSLREYEEIVVRRSRELLDAFEKRKGEELDLSAWMSYFAFDFMGDMVFGASLDLMKNGDDSNGVWRIINAGIELSTILGHIPWAYTMVRLIPGLGRARERTHALADRWVKRRIQEGSKVKDLYYHLTDEEGHEAVKPPLPVVYSDGTLAIIAGSDTTASTFSAIWYYLLIDNRDNGGVVYERLRREIDEVFPAGVEPLDFSKMAGMEYLNGVINEALRLLPPVLSGIQRTAVPGSGGKVVGPYYIPENNHVFVHTHTIHRNPNYFSPLPNSFWPDRWLPAKARQYHPSITSKDAKDFVNDRNAFVPFSMGPANCAGKNLALLELRALVCFIVQRFEFEVIGGFRLEDWEEGIQDYFTMVRPPLPVRVLARRS